MSRMPVSRSRLRRGRFAIGDQHYPLQPKASNRGRGGGKASARMAQALERRLGRVWTTAGGGEIRSWQADTEDW